MNLLMVKRVSVLLYLLMMMCLAATLNRCDFRRTFWLMGWIVSMCDKSKQYKMLASCVPAVSNLL